MKVNIEDVKAAQDRLEGYINRTQLEFSRNCSERIGTNAYLKFENKQRTGSFKIRGALNKMKKLSKDELANGVVAASAGNHAQGVALGASSVGVRSTVVMPEDTPHVKVRATESYGAEVVLHGQAFDESYEHARKIEQERGSVFFHPFADADVIAGQGTIALEILRDLPNVSSVVVPIGGGGLMSGIAMTIKTLKPDCKVYGVVPEVFPGMLDLYQGKDVGPPKAISSIADGTVVKRPNPELCEHFIKKYVDDIVTADESSIAEAMVFLLERAKSLVEGAGAMPLVAAAQKKWDLGEHCCLLLSGGNVDMQMISKVITAGLVKAQRIARIQVIVDDRPGRLNGLTKILAKNHANILQVDHERSGPELQIREVKVTFIIETKSDDHLHQVIKEIKSSGARVQ